MPTHVMGDIETLGPSLIISIGAVKFNQDAVLDKFHVGVDPVDAERYGLKLDASTAWNYWAHPDRDAARKRLYELPKVDLFAALDGFALWCHETPVDERGSLWGNGATFDNVKLKDAYDAVGLGYPFHYRQDECYRTLKKEQDPASELAPKREGVHHHALDDALFQTYHLLNMDAGYRRYDQLSAGGEAQLELMVGDEDDGSPD